MGRTRGRNGVLVASADTKAANASNKRGFALHKKKKYAEAAVEYRKAIAEDPAHLLARYNLACVKIAVFALMQGKRFTRAFEAELMGFEGTGSLVQSGILYDLVFTPAGKTKPTVYP